MDDRTLAEIAAELYTRPPAEFTAARNALAKDADDRALAAGIRSLKKPSIAAWIVNLLAQERSAHLAEALSLAQELREAQADLDAAALSSLGRQRRALTRRLADEAAALGSSRGERVTPTTLEAVRQTLAAAFFDPDAAAAVASGRLIRELEPSGSLDAAFDGVVAGGPPDAPAPTPQPVDEVRERRERRDAERAVHAAEKELLAVERAAAAAAGELKDGRERADRLADRIEELESELARTRHAHDETVEAIATAEQRVKTGRRRVADAEQSLASARAALDRVPGARRTE